MLKPLLREPLVHFLLLGALLFALDGWRRPATGPAANAEIVVSEARARSLAQNFRRTWQRPPTRQELDGLVESYVREEIFYREALALGLDRDDAVIRRRLQQKMEFVSEEAAALARPSDAELQQYLQTHPAHFVADARITFTHVYLDPSRRADRLPADARRLLAALNGPGAPDPAQAGDQLMMLEPRYENATEGEVGRLFGTEFAAAIVEQPAGRWVGPVMSGYGAHLVRVEVVTLGGLPRLDQVRSQVEREWANAKRQELGGALYAKLRAKYTVKVQMPGVAAP